MRNTIERLNGLELGFNPDKRILSLADVCWHLIGTQTLPDESLVVRTVYFDGTPVPGTRIFTIGKDDPDAGIIEKLIEAHDELGAEMSGKATEAGYFEEFRGCTPQDWDLFKQIHRELETVLATHQTGIQDYWV